MKFLHGVFFIIAETLIKDGALHENPFYSVYFTDPTDKFLGC